jgi:hypothetical protein
VPDAAVVGSPAAATPERTSPPSEPTCCKAFERNPEPPHNRAA